MRTDNMAMVVYAIRNDLWKVGGELLDSPKARDKRSGQLLMDIGYLIANHYQENADTGAINDDTWRDSMRQSIKGSVAFSHEMRLD